MLCLNRKKNEVIVIADGIHIVVLEIHDDHVKLGISAPKEVPVDRLEIRQAKQRAEEILRRMANGEALHDIEDDFDNRDPRVSS